MGERVLVAGGSGYAGALAARILHRHPHFELAAVTSRSDVGVPLSELYPHHRVPHVLEELELDRHADVDAAIVAYPHGAAAPLVAAEWDIEQPVAVFALDLGEVIAAAPEVTSYADVVSYPPVRQDLAVILAEDVPAGEAVAVVREAGGGLLTAAEVFDVYTGAQAGEGRRSLALRLTFRAPDRTLTDEDVAPVRERIVGALRERLGGELRG